MNRNLLIGIVSFALIAALFCIPFKKEADFHDLPSPKAASQGEYQENESHKEEKLRQIRARYAQEFKQMRDPKTNTVPMERLRVANQYMQSLQAAGKTSAAIAGVNWTERGPDNVAGRTRAILVDPNDGTGNTVFSAGVSGGLWKTTNMNATNPTWTVVDDFFTNLAITSLAADPSNPQVMYFGTGEGYANIDAVRGDGIWKTTNGGTTWTQLAATTGATFDFVQRIAVNSTGIVLAATATGGLQRSTNGGTTWTKVLGTGLGITGAVSNFGYDIEIAANGDIYASIAGTVHKSTNAGATFGAAQTLGIAADRIELACAPSDANYIYAVVEFGNVVNGIRRTVDGGTTWTARTEPADADPGCPATDFSNGQGWYNLTVAVEPGNRDALMVGGLDLFKSTDGAGTWTQIAHWYGGFGFQYVHADQHIIYYQPGSSTICYFGNDGGIYRTANANAGTPTIDFKGNDYNVTQFYACAIHPTAFSDYFLAGAQDNGSHQFTTAGMNTTTEVTGGDGAFCHIDQDEPQFQFTQYIFNDFYRSTNSGASWTNITAGGTGQFINPTDYDNTNDILYASHNAGQYLRWSDPQTGATFAGVAVAAFGGGSVNAITVSPNTANRVFFGIDNGRVVSCTNAHAAPTGTNISTGLPAAMVSCIEVETGNDNHLLVTYSNFGVNSVWESVNGGASWTSVEGNLPDMPIRWALFNPNNSDQAMVATELGVWTTDNLNGGATVWGPSNTGLANVRTDMLQMRQSDDFVIAATHGRGLYSTDAFTTPTALFTSDKQLTYTAKSVQFTDQSYRATSWLWNFGDGFTSTAQHPSHVYTTAGKYNVSLTINGGASSLTKNQFIHILPDRGTPYVVATDGSTFEINPDDFGSQAVSGGVNKWERGVPSNFLVTVNSPTNVWKTDLDADLTAGTYSCVLQTPSYNFTAPGVYTLQFRRSMEVAFCNGPVAVQLQYSSDKGDTWTRLGVNADPASTNWYNRGPATGCPVDASIFADRYGWTITSNNTLCTYNISTGVPALVGLPNVTFRFVLSVASGFSAPGYAVDGFMVDDFEILGPSNSPNGLAVLASPLKGLWSGTDVALTWETYQEVNSARFEIERSTDGINFQGIGNVQAQGFSSNPHSYSFVDRQPAGERIFYHYRQIDRDGSAQLSNTVELLRSATDAFAMIDVFPNPFTDQLSIRFGEVFPEGGELDIYDIAGRQIHQEILAASTTELLTLREQVASLKPGIYFIRLSYEGKTRTAKVIKHEG